MYEWQIIGAHLHAFNSNCCTCKLVKADGQTATGLTQGLPTLIKQLGEGVQQLEVRCGCDVRGAAQFCKECG